MDLSQDTDENLMLRFGRGDAAAFDALYRRHETRIFRYLQRGVRNEASANDLMQDVWFAVARSAARYQPTAKFTTWLFTLAHNRMVDMIRASRPHQSLDADDGSGGEGSSLAERLADNPNREPHAEVQSLDQAAALLSAVETLPLDQRTAFLLQAEGDLSVEDIAAATGTSFETAKSRLRYARAKLRQVLWEYA
jgi:RNA polymerase sigma factor (sigma-70 family)